VLTTIADDPELAARTVVLVTSDHGGLGTSHPDASLEVNYAVPFLAWGVGHAELGSLRAQCRPSRPRRGPSHLHRRRPTGAQR
jgi:hypothetical protein